jgi:4-carboxymuconolactone decarboxylase
MADRSGSSYLTKSRQDQTRLHSDAGCSGLLVIGQAGFRSRPNVTLLKLQPDVPIGDCGDCGTEGGVIALDCALQCNLSRPLQPADGEVRFGKSKEVTMAKQPNPARERVRGIVPKMIELSEQVIYGDIWERPGLSKRDRSLIVVATLIATYRPEQLKGHLGRALDNGVTKDEIAEIITHLAFYSGWPASVTARRIAAEVYEERGVA